MTEPEIHHGENFAHPDQAPWSVVAVPFRVLLCPEDEGGFSIHSLDLAGVVSQGESEAEAISNITDAIAGAVAVYRESGSTIPYAAVAVDDIPSGSKELQILVNV